MIIYRLSSAISLVSKSDQSELCCGRLSSVELDPKAPMKAKNIIDHQVAGFYLEILVWGGS